MDWIVGMILAFGTPPCYYNGRDEGISEHQKWKGVIGQLFDSPPNSLPSNKIIHLFDL
jgi:hypothetical protein